MKIALIGSKETIKHALPLIDQKSLFVDCIPYICESRDAGKVVASCQKNVDAILFTGNLPYSFACRDVVPTIPWEYMYRDQSALFVALLRESLERHVEICRISSDLKDTLGDKMNEGLNHELGLLKDQLKIYRFSDSPLSFAKYEDYFNELVAFHCNNAARKVVDICVTGIHEIYKAVSSRGFHTVMVAPTMEVIVGQIEKLRLRHQLKMQKKDRIAVVEITFQPREVSQPEQIMGIHDLFLLKKAVQEQLLIFAQQQDGTLEFGENGECRIYLKQVTLETESLSFTQFKLLNRLAALPGIGDIALGVGIAVSHRSACGNARYANQIAQKQKKTCCYIAYEDLHLAGPFQLKRPSSLDKAQSKIQEISRKTNISLNTLKKLHGIIKQYGISSTTTEELSQLCSVSVSNIYRILNKLQASGYIEDIGVVPLGGAGRPRRLFRIRID